VCRGFESLLRHLEKPRYGGVFLSSERRLQRQIGPGCHAKCHPGLPRRSHSRSAVGPNRPCNGFAVRARRLTRRLKRLLNSHIARIASCHAPSAGQTKLTNEHVFPEWTRPFLISLHGPGTHTRTVLRSGREPESRSRPGDPVTLEVKAPGLYRSRWVQEFWREFVETWESFQISTEEVRDCRPRSSRDTGRAMSRENVELVRALQPDPDVNLVDLFGDQETWDSLVKATAPSSTSLGRSGCSASASPHATWARKGCARCGLTGWHLGRAIGPR
jgi:hypothetical protein